MLRSLARIPLCSARVPREANKARKPPTAHIRFSSNDNDTSSISKEGELRKADLVAILATEYKITLAQSARMLDTVLDTIVEVS
ncbi:hypothetical protein HJC23_006581 [Cyclotella cryptica]|uniref:Uncharacterized protein n=1 Tax=Cyclotella cryptica TaxID=29204 RepID=A0ABD3PG95_9STRA